MLTSLMFAIYFTPTDSYNETTLLFPGEAFVLPFIPAIGVFVALPVAADKGKRAAQNYRTTLV